MPAPLVRWSRTIALQHGDLVTRIRISAFFGAESHYMAEKLGQQDFIKLSFRCRPLTVVADSDQRYQEPGRGNAGGGPATMC